MTSLSAAILRILTRAETGHGRGAGIYLTQRHTDELLDEMGMGRENGVVMCGTFNRVPLYLDRDVSMVICHDRAGEAYLTFI